MDHASRHAVRPIQMQRRLKQATAGKGTTFVAATKSAPAPVDAGTGGQAEQQQQNEDEIRISDDEDL